MQNYKVVGKDEGRHLVRFGNDGREELLTDEELLSLARGDEPAAIVAEPQAETTGQQDPATQTPASTETPAAAKTEEAKPPVAPKPQKPPKPAKAPPKKKPAATPGT